MVGVTMRVVDDCLALDGFLRDGEGEMDTAVLGRGGENGEFQRAEGLSNIAVGFFRKVAERFRVGLHLIGAEAPFRIRERALQHGNHILDGDRLELEDLRAGDERRVDVEIRVVRRRTDEADHPALDVREKHVLLRLVETVDLVDEQDGGLATQVAPGAGLVDLRADLRHVGLHAVERLEA